ncbi:MAG: PQQ-dependent dehydrogenase, methanol/ethanol family [Halioglobus sp.]
MRFLTLALIMILAACSKQQPASPNEKPDPKAADSVAAASVNWTKHGLTDSEQRFSPLNQITQDNVDELGLSWSFDMYTRRGVQATPLMVDNTLYVSGSWSMVYALDAVTGELKWFYDPKVPRATLAKGCCDAVNRGVAYTDGKIYVGTYDGRLVALNAESGEVVWETLTVDQSRPYTITGAPRIAGNNIIIGNGGAELGVRGYVTAYDINSGEQSWRFYTIPGNPADGFESDALEMAAKTWNGEWWEWGGGGTAWDSMAYDPELNLFYVGVGNGSPWNQTLRSPGGGDNLFLSSIVALNAKTGEYVWHYQTTPGETWDYTATQHIMLADLKIDGEDRKVLMQAPKNGFFYVLDRATGELLSAEKFTIATWASHVDMETGRPVETETARLFDGKNIHIPSNGGGHNWPPMSYNPDTGLVYIPTLVFPGNFLAPTRDIDRLPKQGTYNTGFDRMALVPPNDPDIDAILDSQFTAKLIAWDPIAQKEVWAQQPGRPAAAGTLSTAGNLVFQVVEDKLIAYNAVTGDELWSNPTQTIAGGSPVTYAIDGQQYIAVAVGFGGGIGAEAGAISHAWKAKNRSRVLVFKLGGEHSLPALVETPERPMAQPEAVTANAEQVLAGQILYQRHCSFCHGDGLRSSGLVPDLRHSTAAIHELWQDILIGGILSPRGMVSFDKYLSAEDAEGIRQYVLSEANRVYSAQ